jgi:hypothetical protein
VNPNRRDCGSTVIASIPRYERLAPIQWDPTICDFNIGAAWDAYKRYIFPPSPLLP